MTKFRLSAGNMRTTVAVALAMTAAVAALVWMLLSAQRHPNATWWTLAAGGLFFAFCSAAMLVRWLRGDVVFAALPTGLYDARWRAEPVAWEAIRELVLRRAENEFSIDVYLWRPQSQPGSRPDHVVEIAPLEGGVQRVVEAIARYAAVRIDASLQAGAQGGYALAGKEPI